MLPCALYISVLIVHRTFFYTLAAVTDEGEFEVFINVIEQSSRPRKLSTLFIFLCNSRSSADDPTTNGGSPALILALRDAAASKQLDLSQWARKMTTGSSDSGAVTGLLPRPNSAGSNRFSSRPGSISSSSGGGGSSSANGPFNGPDSVDSALALLDTLMSGDVGGHWDDDAWDRVRYTNNIMN